jgi:organic hydroperoxide reductase OsmC/OhrA
VLGFSHRLNGFLTVPTGMLNHIVSSEYERRLNMRVKSKYPEKIEYHSTSEWDGLTGGTATVSTGRKIIYDTPETYGGRGDGMCPDELFVSAVLGCLNNTFLDFQRRFEMELKLFTLRGTAIAVFDGTGYRITGVSVSGEVVVGEDELETGKRCIELMKEYCHLTRTIKDCLPVTFDISIREG